jgi:4-amino-4-deoxy-L-arabinose transferase-like glycosyltransferase
MTSRLEALLPAAAFVAALLFGIFVSSALGPAFEELPRLRAIEQCEPVVRAAASRGPAALIAPEARAAYASFDGRGTLLALLGAWSKLSIGRVGLFDPLTSARLPFIALTALGAAALAALVRPSRGVFTALLTVAALLAMPRWLHAAAVMRDGALVASVWLLVLWAYLRSLGPSRRRLCWAALGACLVGVGAALSFAALWVLALIAIHFAYVRRRWLTRLLGRGRIPVPALLLLSLPLAPLALFATNPALWGTNGPALVRYMLGPLSPTVLPTPFAGRVVSKLPVPGGYAASWLVQTLPLALGLAALVGLAWVAHQALARRFASGRLRPAREPQALAALCALGLAAALIGPALAPDAFTHFPPRVELALPFVAMLTGIGLGRLAAVDRRTRGRSLAAAVIAASMLAVLRSPATLSASFEPLLGGAARVSASGALASVDGSELAALAPALDRAGGEQVSVHAPDVPAELWDAMRRGGRLQTPVAALPAPTPGAFVLARGRAEGDVVASVDRGPTRLWTLLR